MAFIPDANLAIPTLAFYFNAGCASTCSKEKIMSTFIKWMCETSFFYVLQTLRVDCREGKDNAD